jgi:hypothetical protein
LLKVHEDRLLVIANDPRDLLLGIIDELYVLLDDRLQILPELFLRLNQFANDGSRRKMRFRFPLNSITVCNSASKSTHSRL